MRLANNDFTHAYSGVSPGGTTMLMTSEMSLYFMMRSAVVVDVSDGDAFTYPDKRVNGINKLKKKEGVYLDEPGLEVVINDYVKTVALVTMAVVGDNILKKK